MRHTTIRYIFLALALLTTQSVAKDKFLTVVAGQNRSVTSADNIEAFTNTSSAVAVGNAVYLSGSGSVAKASATTLLQPALGLVYELTDSTHCLVITRGVFSSYTTGMTAGTAYYLAETSGTLQTSPVLVTGKLAQYVGVAVSASDLLVQPQNMSLSGTSGGQYVTLLPDGKLPALDGSNLTSLPGGMGGTAGTTDNILVRANGTSGNTLQGSAITADDSGNLTGVGTIDGYSLSSFQASDATLTAYAGGTCSADTLLYCSGTDQVSSATITSAGRTLFAAVDSAAERTALGLGTAATSASSAFQAADTELTTLSGFSWSAGTQFPAWTAASTLTTLTVGTSASNVVQLTSGSNYPTGGLNTCAWTKSWAAADSSLVTAGFTLTNLSEAAATTDTAGAYYVAISSTSAVGKITWASNLPTNTSSWEVEIDWAPNVTSPFTQDGSNGIGVDPGNTGIKERMMISTNFINAGSVSWGSTAKTNSQYRQTWTMLRHASGFTYAFLNGVPLGMQPMSNGASGSTQEWCFGNCGATTTTRTSRVYAIRIKAAGVCAYPPNMRNYGVITQ